MMRTTIHIMALALLIVGLTGCMAVRETYPGHQPDHVWTAMQAVAESPEYDDWHVIENRVWSDPEHARLEVYRVNRRTLHRPRARPLDEKREWKFQIVLEETHPPTAAFRTRSGAVPAHARLEAERYLRDVRQMLREISPDVVVAPEAEAEAQPEPEPEPEPAPDPEEAEPDEQDAHDEPESPAGAPPIDIDDLARGG